MPRISPTDTETQRYTQAYERGVLVAHHFRCANCGRKVQRPGHLRLRDTLCYACRTPPTFRGKSAVQHCDELADRGARGVAASAQPTETQTAARDSAAAVGGTCQANTDAAQPQSPSGVGTCAQDAIASGGD